MLIMATLLVMTAVTMADATPACSYYCELFFSSKPPGPVDCDCRSLQEQDSLLKKFKRQVQANQSTFTPQPKGKLYDIQRPFTKENESLNINVNNEEDSKSDPNKINDSKNTIQIDTIKKCVIVYSILMSGRKLTNTKFKVNLKTEEINNYKHLTDSEIMEIANKECNGVGTNSDWNMNNDPTLNGIITNNINLKEDNFNVISESIKVFKDLDSTFFKYKRTSRTQLQLSAPKEILSTEYSTNSRTKLSATENTTAITVLSDEIIQTTPPPKKYSTAKILTAKNITEKNNFSQNITSIVDNKNILETSTLNAHLNPNTSASDNTNLLDRNGNSDGQIIDSILEPVKHQTSKGLSKDHNESTKRINQTQNSMSTTRNNSSSKSLVDRNGNSDGKITDSILEPVKHQTSKDLSKNHNGSTKRVNEVQNSMSTTRNNITSKSLVDRNGNSDGKITDSVLEPVKNQTSKDLSKNHNELTKRINEVQNSTSTTRNNITSKSLAGDTHETAKITAFTINQTKDIENEFRTLNNKPKSNYLNSDNNDGTFFRRNYNDRQYYNESEIPIVRIVSREYPNDTVSSIIDGTEILPNDDFRDEEFKSRSAKINRITVPIVDSPYPNASQSKFKQSMQKDTVEKSSAKNIINGKPYFKCKRKPSVPLKINLEISTVCDQTDKQNKSQSILLSILCN